MSSCCGGNCGCGSDCKCGSSCSGCKMYPNMGEESFSTSQATILGVAPQKCGSGSAGFEAAGGAENGGCNCKCGDKCTCDPCNCK